MLPFDFQGILDSFFSTFLPQKAYIDGYEMVKSEPGKKVIIISNFHELKTRASNVHMKCGCFKVALTYACLGFKGSFYFVEENSIKQAERSSTIFNSALLLQHLQIVGMQNKIDWDYPKIISSSKSSINDSFQH